MLDGIVVVVDALHRQQQLDQHAVVQRQVGFADRLLLSKCDLVDGIAIEARAEQLSRISPRASQQRLQQGSAEAGSLLGIGGFNLDASLLAVGSNGRRPGRFVPPSMPTSGLLRWSKNTTVLNDEITSLLLEAGEVDLGKMSSLVQTMIDEFGDSLLRYKGILAVVGENRKLIFQGVQRIAGFDCGEEWQAEDARISRIVIIGRTAGETNTRSFLAAQRKLQPYPCKFMAARRMRSRLPIGGVADKSRDRHP